VEVDEISFGKTSSPDFSFRAHHFVLRQMMSAAAATPPAAAFNLVDVDPGAIRPVEKVQADESHGRVLDACLAPRQHVVTRRELKAPLDACILSDVVSPD
jgi:hypothetical protein